jgi:SAM-dependent methyltransferase
MSHLQTAILAQPTSLPRQDPFDLVAARLAAMSQPGVRWLAGYGQNKVRLDQLYRAALPWIPAAATVLDLGCGIGLLGLLLDSRGQGNRTCGIEWDQAKAEFGQRVAEGSAVNQIVCGNLMDEPWPACTVITVLDVLHYLSPMQQRALFARMGSHLSVGSRLLLRSMDADRGGLAVLTRWLERIAVGFGWNQASRVHWRSLSDLCADLSEAGFLIMPRFQFQDSASGNQMLVFEKT